MKKTAPSHPASSKEDRTAYRVVPGVRDGLSVSLTMSSGESLPGNIVDVTIKGAGIDFSGESVPTIKKGSKVELTFNAPKLERPISVHAELTYFADDGGFRRCGFRFLEQIEVSYPKLHRLFNRRGAYRVAPAADEKITVHLKALSDQSFPELSTARMTDISISGIGLEVPKKLDSQLAGATILEVSFTLPSTQGQQRLVAHIVRRRPQGNTISYGLRFDPDQTTRYLFHERQIAHYIAMRQQEMLKRAIR